MLTTYSTILLFWLFSTIAMLYLSPKVCMNAEKTLNIWKSSRKHRLTVLFAILISGFTVLPDLQSQFLLLLGLTLSYVLTSALHRH